LSDQLIEWEVDVGRVVSATEARIHLGELMRQAVENREPILVERGGEPYVVILAVATYQRLLKGQPKENWRGLVEEARKQIRSELSGRELPPLEEVVRQTREERDTGLVDLR
jgi:prevent-host-death family protein